MKSPADGANAERKAFRGYVRRAMRKTTFAGWIDGNAALAWIGKRTARYQKNAGGLGKVLLLAFALSVLNISAQSDTTARTGQSAATAIDAQTRRALLGGDGPTFAALNRRFDLGRIGERQQGYLWTLAQLRLIRPELRGTTRETTYLTVARLSDGDFDGDETARVWSVRNRAGRPLKPRPALLLPEVDFIAKGVSDYVLRTTEHEGFDRLLVFVFSGSWVVQTRLSDFDSIWQAVTTLQAGDAGAYLYKRDFFRHEYRIVAAP